jgi:plastocyanin
MRGSFRLAALAALAPLLGAPAASARLAMDMGSGSGQTTPVAIQFVSFNPGRVSVLTGDTVTWNDVSRMHTVSEENGAWTSARLVFGDTYSRQFNQPGVVHYYCMIHPFMRGEVDVSDLLLAAPATPAASGKPYPLRGRAALPEGTTVTIEGNSGSGFAPVATAGVAADGSFVASLRPTTSTKYRAVSGDMTSATVQLTVIEHRVLVSDVRRAGIDHLTVRVTPAAPRSTVVLQLHLKERFGWWPELQKRLNNASVARFTVSLPDRQVKARVALTLPDGATQLALSRVLLVGNKPR